MNPSAPGFLGIDVGTSAVKGVVLSTDGTVVASAAVPHATHITRPEWAEQRPEDWWDGVLSVLAKLGSVVRLDGVRGIGVSSQAPTLLAVDASGRPVRDALIWMDRRAEPQCQRFAASGREQEFLELTGNPLDASLVLPKLLWMKENEQPRFRRTAHFLQANGYVVLRLTGALSLDESHASLLGLRTPGATGWSEVALAEAGISASQLPPVSRSDTVVGGVTERVAALTGLQPGTPVVAGTVDSAAAALDAGASADDMAVEVTGSSGVLVMPTACPVSHPAFLSMAAAERGWLALAPTVASGAALQWFSSVAGASGLDDVLAAAAKADPGANGVLFVPYLMGERAPVWDTGARGAFVGLSLLNDHADLARAVLEGAALALRHNLTVAASLGLAPRRLRSTGGPTASDLWCQVKADVTGLPVERLTGSGGAARGAGIVAVAGTGNGALAALSSSGVEVTYFRPNPSHAVAYDEVFARYLEASRAVLSLGHGARGPLCARR